MKMPDWVATVTAPGDGIPYSNRRLFDPWEKPTIDSGNESIVTTHAIFIRGGELEKVMGHLHEAETHRL